MAGISMSSSPLGASDSQARWIGIRRHQAMLSIAGVLLSADWFTGSHRSLVELFLGVLLLLLCIPVSPIETATEMAVSLGRFVGRSHWSTTELQFAKRGVFIGPNVDAPIAGFRLKHLGRLDLSGGDIRAIESLRSLITSISINHANAHVSLHCVSDLQRVETLLSTAAGAPEGDWVRDDELIKKLSPLSGDSRVLCREHWDHLRSPDAVLRVLKVWDFSGVTNKDSLLTEVLRSSATAQWSLHVDVIGASQARRLTARAVHGISSDAVTTKSIGFRRTARADYVLKRVQQREIEVAEGETLLKIAVYALIRAEDLWDLRSKTLETIQKSNDAGLRLDTGAGRQAEWLKNYLPRVVGE